MAAHVSVEATATGSQGAAGPSPQVGNMVHAPVKSLTPTTNNPDRSWKDVCSLNQQLDRFSLDPSKFIGKVKVDAGNGSGKVPCVRFDKSILEDLSEAWKLSVIFKPVGTKIKYDPMARKIKEVMKIQGNFRLSDLPHGYFLLRFKEKSDYMAVLTGGPWMVFGFYLAVKPWEVSFDPRTDKITTTPVWVRIHNLPILFYEETTLHFISSALGNPIKTDNRTLFAERGRYARICIEVDIAQELPSSMIVDGEELEIEFENLNFVCSGCGIFGHGVIVCPARKSTGSVNHTSALESTQVVALAQTEGGAATETGWKTHHRHIWVPKSGNAGLLPPLIARPESELSSSSLHLAASGPLVAGVGVDPASTPPLPSLLFDSPPATLEGHEIGIPAGAPSVVLANSFAALQSVDEDSPEVVSGEPEVSELGPVVPATSDILGILSSARVARSAGAVSAVGKGSCKEQVDGSGEQISSEEAAGISKGCENSIGLLGLSAGPNSVEDKVAQGAPLISAAQAGKEEGEIEVEDDERDVADSFKDWGSPLSTTIGPVNDKDERGPICPLLLGPLTRSKSFANTGGTKEMVFKELVISEGSNELSSLNASGLKRGFLGPSTRAEAISCSVLLEPDPYRVSVILNRPTSGAQANQKPRKYGNLGSRPRLQ